MHVLCDPSGQVAKYLHEDGSETAIKIAPSIELQIDPDTGEWVERAQERQKVSVILSSSRGCIMRCAFCHLTQKKAECRPLSMSQVLDNAQEAMIHWYSAHPETQNYAIKLCFMGMGEALARPTLLAGGTRLLLKEIFENGWARALDSVDIGTVMPAFKHNWVPVLADLNRELTAQYPNPERPADRSAVRLFYSLHSAVQTTRDILIPDALPLAEAQIRLREVMRAGINVIVHQMFLSPHANVQEVLAITDFMDGLPVCQLRVLRFNPLDGMPVVEWDKAAEAACWLQRRLPNVKIQGSPGRAVSAACGQFIVTRPSSPAYTQ